MVRRHADRLRRIAILAALAQRATSERAREIIEDIEALAQGRRPRNRDRCRLATEPLIAGDELKALPRRNG